MTARSIWFNGKPVESVLAHSRGLHYGDGIFRTILNYSGQLIDVAKHLIKASADARQLDLEPPPTENLLEDLEKARSGTDTCVVKLILVRRARERGYRSEERECDRLIMKFPAPRYDASCWSAGVRVFRSPFTLALQPALAGIKHLSRLEQVLASRHWVRGMDEGILADVEGHPVSGTRSNLFWVHRSVVYTPELKHCGVAGIMRARVIGLARQLQLECREVRADWPALGDAEEMFLTNSLIGIWPVREYDGRSLPAPGPVTRRLRSELAHPELH